MTPDPNRPMDLTTVGEGQLRLTTGLGTPLESVDALNVFVAGSEANVAGMLSRLGRRTGMVTALPDSPLGRRVATELRAGGTDLSRTLWRAEGRVALYFVEENAAPIPSRVFYDRANSAFTTLQADEVDWPYLASSRLLHLTGITAALTDGTRELMEASIDQAARAGQQVSFDVNFRRALWTSSAAAAWVERAISGRVTVLVCARRDAEELFGLSEEADVVARALAERFGARTVLVSDGAATLHCLHDGVLHRRTPLPVTVVDRVGAGDALVGGFLHGYLAGDAADGLALGAAAAALALTRRGDQLHTTEAELRDVARRTVAGDIDR